MADKLVKRLALQGLATRGCVIVEMRGTAPRGPSVSPAGTGARPAMMDNYQRISADPQDRPPPMASTSTTCPGSLLCRTKISRSDTGFSAG